MNNLLNSGIEERDFNTDEPILQLDRYLESVVNFVKPFVDSVKVDCSCRCDIVIINHTTSLRFFSTNITLTMTGTQGE